MSVEGLRDICSSLQTNLKNNSHDAMTLRSCRLFELINSISVRAILTKCGR